MKKITLTLALIMFYLLAQCQQLFNCQLNNYKDIRIFENTNQTMSDANTHNSKQSQSIIWSSTMNIASQWTVANEINSTIGNWAWISDTSFASPKFKLYVNPSQNMKSPTANNGLFYFDGITSLSNAIYGISNSVLKYNSSISTIGHPTVILKFFELYKAFNRDSIFVEISTNNIIWQSFPVHKGSSDLIYSNEYRKGWYELNISSIAANQPNVWLRFRYKAPDNTPIGQQYSGGYGWMIDDVSLEDAPANLLKIKNIVAGNNSNSIPYCWNGYTQIPLGQNYTSSFRINVENIGSLTQNNIKAEVTELTTNSTAYSQVIPSLGINNSTILTVNNINNFSNPGTYLFKISISSDSINSVIFKDTIAVVINTNGTYSRDYNYFGGDRYENNNPFCIANSFQVNDSCIATSINFMVTYPTTVGSKVKAILYRGLGQNKTIVAESDLYEIKNTDIMNNSSSTSPTLNLSFINGVNAILEKDSSYYAAVKVIGYNNGVTIPLNNSIPQQSNSVVIYDSLSGIWSDFSDNKKVPLIQLKILPLNSPYLFPNLKWQNIDFSAGSFVNFAISTNLTNWNATTNVNWISLVKNIATGTLTVIADSSYINYYGRSAEIIVSGIGVQPDTLLVFQTGTNFRTIPRNIVLNSPQGSTVTLDVLTSVANWKAYSSDAWLSVSSDCLNKKIYLTANTANTANTPRYSRLIVQSKGITLQSPSYVAQKSNLGSMVEAVKDTTFGHDGEFNTIDVLTDLPNWNSYITDIYPILYPQADTTNDYIYVLTFQENTSNLPYPTKIYLSGNNAPTTSTIFMLQSENTYFSYDKSYITLGDTINSVNQINVTTQNQGWYAICDAPWVNITYNNALGKIYAVSSQANTSNSARYAKIKIRYQGYTIETLYVIQSPPGPSIVISPISANIPSFIGASAMFNYTSNLNNLIFTTNVNWLNIVNTKSSGIITVSAKSANLSNTPRIAYITVRGDVPIQQTITVIQSPGLGIYDNEKNYVNIYPNPAINNIYIDFGQKLKNFASVTIFSITGKTMFNSTLNANTNELTSIDITSLSKGIYFIKIQTDKESLIRKFIKD